MTISVKTAPVGHAYFGKPIVFVADKEAGWCLSQEDAMADAETLRRVALEIRSEHELGALRNEPEAIDAFNAAAQVAWQIRVMDSHQDKLWIACASLAARAAFRACPALRESK